MGNTQSEVPKEGQGHPGLFYRGVRAAKEARFTISELYFVQALGRHPGRPFWNTLMPAVLDREVSRKKSDAPFVAQVVASSEALEEPEVGGAVGKAGQPGDSRYCTEARGGRGGGRPSLSEGEDDSDVLKRDACLAAQDVSFDTEVKDILLPLDSQVRDTLDFLRLLADMALTYLDLLTTTCHTEKVRCIAARYCLLVVSHTQVLLHCLTLWKEEHLPHRGGLIHYAGQHNQSRMASLHDDANDGEVVVNGWGTPDGEQKGGPRTSCTYQRNFALALVEATCRYYFISFTVSYAGLLIGSYGAAVTGRSRRQGVYDNAVDHLEAALAIVRGLAREYPNEYLSKVILQSFPEPSRGARWPRRRSSGTSLHFSCMKLLPLSSGHYRHIYTCGATWSPLQSALVPLAYARSVRLVVEWRSQDCVDAYLVSPGCRTSYHYLSWLSEAKFLAVPGCSQYMLERALPDFVPWKGTRRYKTEILLSPKASELAHSTACPPSSLHPSLPLTDDAAVRYQAVAMVELIQRPPLNVVDEMSASAKKALMRKWKESLKKSGRNINTDLDFSDARTCVMLCQNEACFLGISALLNFAQLHKAAGEVDAAAAYGRAVENLVEGLFEPQSAELHMVRFLLHGGMRS
ncbi:hypothetical protein LSCM1_01391 [Leishmania martiniquensis]|uniref:Sodium stibogluconate resistance protein n=1 Tax=Leishmania martiniquensis TaxID=1580590 RepID=A0A836FXU5_9TRYP|nr:hypothetical protein LSCM1_01391 [Leishmania martiniquensis]